MPNFDENPEDTLSFLYDEMEITSCDILFPDITLDDVYRNGSLARYYVQLYEAWKRKYIGKIDVRILKSLISSSLGAGSSSESLGLGPSSLFVVDSDGTCAYHDVLKICRGFKWDTGMSLDRHSIQHFVMSDGFKRYILS